MLLNLKKKNNSKVIFVRQDKIFFITSLYFFKKISFNKYIKFFVWRSINDHFLWRLRNISIKTLNLSSEFLNKFKNFNV